MMARRSRRFPLFWRQIRRAVFERDNYECRVCHSRAGPLECDHIRPVHRGGSDELSNLQTLCRTCHIAKTSSENAPDIAGRDEWQRFATRGIR